MALGELDDRWGLFGKYGAMPAVGRLLLPAFGVGLDFGVSVEALLGGPTAPSVAAFSLSRSVKLPSVAESAPRREKLFARSRSFRSGAPGLKGVKVAIVVFTGFGFAD